jgi:hypothetical protein
VYVQKNLNGFDRHKIGLVNERALAFYYGASKKRTITPSPTTSLVVTSQQNHKPFATLTHSKREQTKNGISEQSHVLHKIPTQPRKTIVAIPSRTSNYVNFHNTDTGLHLSRPQNTQISDSEMARMLTNIQKRLAAKSSITTSVPTPTTKRRLTEIYEISSDDEVQVTIKKQKINHVFESPDDQAYTLPVRKTK